MFNIVLLPLEILINKDFLNTWFNKELIWISKFDARKHSEFRLKFPRNYTECITFYPSDVNHPDRFVGYLFFEYIMITRKCVFFLNNDFFDSVPFIYAKYCSGNFPIYYGIPRHGTDRAR